MKKRGIAVLVAIILILAVALPAFAITYGEPDEGQHPYVGMIGFYDENGDWLWRCSGTLLSPRLMLTAGHCTAYDPEYGTPASAEIWFDEEIIYDPDLDDYVNPVWATGVPYPHAGYVGLYIPDTHDIGVVVLDEPVEMARYGQLPPLGFLDDMANKKDRESVIFTDVGYGVNDMRPVVVSLRTRYKALSFLLNLENAVTDGYNLQTSNNPGKWAEDGVSGGTCFGDSGGPIFYGGYDSDLVVGIVSFGMNANCDGPDFAYRVDIVDSYDFLSDFAEYGITFP
jgi:hypothetical protein